MSHMVIFQTPDGDQGYNQFETVEESVAFVESLRNEQNVLSAKIFKLDEVKFEFRPYFRVQLAQLGAGDPPPAYAPAPTAAAAPAAAPAVAPAPAPAVDAPVADSPTLEAPAPAPLTGEVRLGSVTLGEAPADVISAPPAADPAAPANLDSPVGAGGATNGSSFGAGEEERGRRGLFGR
ncbi:MAG: hypothetical protein GX868_12970 [Actinobacteria bacterium]|nr:hypothetical protein [Actinomycetota bacterium]